MSTQKQATSSRPRVLVATASIGAGHNSAAQAIVRALKTAAPPIDAACDDVLAFTPRVFRAYYARGFALAMTKLRGLYGLSFRLTDRPHRPGRSMVERRRLWTERLAMRRFARRLLEYRPNVIINTHFLAAPLIGRMIGQGQLEARQVVVVTDIQVHRFWYAENVEHWFVPADFSADLLRRWGIRDEQITVSGIPIHPKWTQRLDRRKIMHDWLLPADKEIVLLAGGTDFTCGPIAKTAQGILRACRNAFLVVLAGRNKKLLGKLAQIAATNPRLKPLGFTDRVHELVEVASLMVTKAGGITTAECLAKGTAMLLMNPVGGHERGNAEYLARQGAAVIARKGDDVAETVRGLLADENALKRLSENARRLHRPATQTIAQAICRTCDEIARR